MFEKGLLERVKVLSGDDFVDLSTRFSVAVIMKSPSNKKTVNHKYANKTSCTTFCDDDRLLPGICVKIKEVLTFPVLFRMANSAGVFNSGSKYLQQNIGYHLLNI